MLFNCLVITDDYATKHDLEHVQQAQNFISLICKSSLRQDAANIHVYYKVNSKHEINKYMLQIQLVYIKFVFTISIISQFSFVRLC